MVRLTPLDKAGYPIKFVPTFMGPWVVVERYSNNVTYRVRDLVSAKQRQLTRDQFEVVELPSRFGSPNDPNKSFLPHLVVADEAVHTLEAVPDAVDEAPDVSLEEVPPPASGGNNGQQVSSSVTEEPAAESETRYGLRPVAVRRARAAELRHEAAAKRRAGSALG